MLLSGDDREHGMRLSTKLTLAGVGGAILLVGLVFLLDAGRPGTQRIASTEINEDVTDLIGPAVLDESASSSGMLDPSIGLDLPAGGWIQIADAQGNLSQQYRCEHLDPDPPELPAHWIDMTRPQVELFLQGGRLLTIEGEQATIYAPSRALEMGQISGQVRINLYEPVDGEVADPAVDPPSMEMRTPNVSFDNFLGKITCAQRIDVSTPTEEMVGMHMEVLMNEESNRIEHMRLKQLDYLLIHPESQTIALAPNPDWPRREHNPGPAPSMRRGGVVPVAMRSMQDTPKPADFYRLTLHDNVRILQGDARYGRTVTGNIMHVTFSFQQSGEAEALVHAPTDHPIRRPQSEHEWLLASVLGNASAPTIGPDDVLVTCDDGLTMVPALTPDERLDDPDDTRAELLGTPVYILDAKEQTEITCDRVLYNGLQQRFDLLADEPDHTVVLRDPRLLARSSHMWIAPERGLGGFVESGSITVREEQATPDANPAIPASANAALTLDDAASTDPPSSTLDITWTEGVDIQFDSSDESDNPSIQSIVFKGDVDVISPDGVFASDWMRMNFAKDGSGKAVPSRLLAREQVRAHNDDQTIWADDLEVTFMVDENAQADTGPDDERSSLIGEGTEVKDVFANGDVQVLMDDGARVFAEHLVADAAQEQVILTGDNVVIARNDLLIDHGVHVELERRNGTAEWKGPGQARLLREPLDLTADRRLERPKVPRRTTGKPGSVTMRARWNDGMDYDSMFNDGAGSIKLQGKVKVVAEPKPTEQDRLNGDTMILQFVHQDDVTSREGDTLSSALQSNREEDPFQRGGDRVLEQLIAKGNAQLEQRVWADDRHEGTPKLFYVAARHITWNDIETSAEVIGNGELVMRQPVSTELQDSPDGIFKGPGTSRFVWTRRLDMVQTEDGGFDIDMTGDVEGIYKGVADADTATITAQQVRAVTAPPPLQDDAPTNDAVLDLGSDLEIERLFAEGGVYIATPNRRVDCNIFDYNLATGLARLDSAPGRTVSILTEGSPTPVRAGSVLWNMDPAIDTITITGARGGGISP